MKLRKLAIVRRAVTAMLLISMASGLLGWWFFYMLLPVASRPMRIASGSMAPALLGPHRRKRCEDCAFPFSFDAALHRDEMCVCPNCGMSQALPADVLPGDRVAVVPLTQILRGQVIAFRKDRDGETRAETKRVLGLPGEQIEIREGDIWIDGKRYRKNVVEMKDVAMSVYVDSFRPRSQDGTGRLRAKAGAGWRWQYDMHSWLGTEGTDKDSGWLAYHHSEGLPPPFVRRMPVEVTDNYAYNQSASRSLQRVDDWFATLQVRADGIVMRMMLVAYGRMAVAECHVATDAVSFRVNGELWRGAQRFAKPGVNEWTQVLVGCWDRQWVLALNGAEIMRIPVVELPPPTKGEEFDESQLMRPFRIAARGIGEIHVRDVRLWRDIHYTPVESSSDWALPRLGVDEYLVLGDNSPISRDARHGESFGIVHRGRILGAVIERD